MKLNIDFGMYKSEIWRADLTASVDGSIEGCNDTEGAFDGSRDKLGIAEMVGRVEGMTLGSIDGCPVGSDDGSPDGSNDIDGCPVGADDGCPDGSGDIDGIEDVEGCMLGWLLTLGLTILTHVVVPARMSPVGMGRPLRPFSFSTPMVISSPTSITPS